MDFTVNKLENYKVQLNHTVATDEVSKLVNKETQNLKKNIRINGFRKGHVPNEIIQKQYGSFIVENLYKAIARETEEYLRKNKIFNEVIPGSLVFNIDIDRDVVNTNKEISVSVEYISYPEVEKFPLSEVNFEKVVSKVTDENITRMIDVLKRRFSESKENNEKAIETGDYVVFSFKGSVDGEYFEGGSADSHKLLIGSNQFIPGFEDQLIGHKVGEKFDINVTFPESYHAENLAGKPAKFEIEVKSILENIPASDDVLFNQLNVDNIDALRAELSKTMNAQLTTSICNLNLNLIFEALYNKIKEKVELTDDIKKAISSELVNEQKRQYVNYLQQLKQKVSQEAIDKFEEFYKPSEDEISRKFYSSLIQKLYKEEMDISSKLNKERIDAVVERESVNYDVKDIKELVSDAEVMSRCQSLAVNELLLETLEALLTTTTVEKDFFEILPEKSI